jgi:hypothetical protein
MNDAAQHTPIIDTAGAGLVAWQVRLNRQPLPVAQPKLVRHDSNSSNPELESHSYEAS